MQQQETIVALSTPAGVGGIAVIRVSGQDAIALVNRVFDGKNLENVNGYSLHFGEIKDGDRLLDEVLVSVFRSPRSFTKEDMAEISCHGSPLIAREIIMLLRKQGARLAKPGEFTQRAYLNGRFDLAQAEAVADLINAETEMARQAAMNQMRGGFSRELAAMREELIHFASMVEMELDFAEEDVEFVKRDELRALAVNVRDHVTRLMNSFQSGNAIRNGVPVVIAGKPNAGKSTLLNALVKEERALVSDIPGTTRDTVEDEMVLEGIRFRFIDTAGLRETEDIIEAMGVKRTREQMQKASIIIYLADAAAEDDESLARELQAARAVGITVVACANKSDLVEEPRKQKLKSNGWLLLSAAKGAGLELLQEKLIVNAGLRKTNVGDVLVTNLRHFEALERTSQDLERVINGIDQGITGDFIAMDIRQALHHLGEITGEITTDDLLGNIFSKFCIGK